MKKKYELKKVSNTNKCQACGLHLNYCECEKMKQEVMSESVVIKKESDRIEEMREKHYQLAEEAMDMVLGDISSNFDREEFMSKLEASKHGMKIVNNFELMKRISAGANIRIINMYPAEQQRDLIEKHLRIE